MLGLDGAGRVLVGHVGHVGRGGRAGQVAGQVELGRIVGEGHAGVAGLQVDARIGQVGLGLDGEHAAQVLSAVVGHDTRAAEHLQTQAPSY